MRNHRPILLAVLAGLTFGSLLATGGYAYYLRSDAYRNSCADMLSRNLDLPAEIGRVVPLSTSSTAFEAVRIWLPDRRDQVAYCERAVLTYTPRPNDPEAYELTLTGGGCEISARTWLRDDYRAMLESGLRPGFDPLGPRRVLFSEMNLRFEHDLFQATFSGAHGILLFEDPQLGRASVQCDKLNDRATPEPVRVEAEFSPSGRQVRLDRVRLAVPEIPLTAIGLERLIGVAPTTGRFRGELVYHETPEMRELTLQGSVLDGSLPELTGTLPGGPFEGTAPLIEVEALRLVNGAPAALRFSGTIANVRLDDVLAPFELSDVGGTLLLRVNEVSVDEEGVARLVASGECERLSLAALSEAIGWGRMSGTAHVLIEDLMIEHNRVRRLRATIDVAPDEAGDNWIERELLSRILEQTLKVRLPDFLPERFNYAELGVELEINDEILDVFGTHGARGKTILTVRVGERTVPVLREPNDGFDLKRTFDAWRAEWLPQWKQAWRDLRPGDTWRAQPRSGAPKRPSAPVPEPSPAESLRRAR